MGSLYAQPSTAEHDLSTGETVPLLRQTSDGEAFVQFRSDLTLKLFRHIEPGINPDLELRRFLTERTSFERLAPVYGSIEYHCGADFSVGIMQQSLDPEKTAWTLFRRFCNEYLDRTTDQPAPPVREGVGWAAATETPAASVTEALDEHLDRATSLGVTTAEFHQALATFTEEPDLRPEPFTAHYRQSLYQSLRAVERQELRAIRRLIGTAPESVRPALREILAGERAMLDQIDHVRRVPMGGQRTRIHGNYRLDELRLFGDDFYVLDLSGDHTRAMSERRLKASPLRDIAQMLRSLDYVSLSTALSHPSPTAGEQANYWYRCVGERFFTAYYETLAGSPALPTSIEDIDALLRSYELARALREVHWEMVNRPDWIEVALPGVLRYIR
jgi:maltose alpha-D-glucosyltransferase/alpha-amylase